MDLLYNGALELGLTLDDAKLSKFETYYEALRTWNQKVNLTAITEYSSVQILSLIHISEPTRPY